MTEFVPLADWERELLRQGDPNVSEATSPLTVYVAGPMRGVAEFNFPAFEEATAQLRSRGYKVISPAEQDLDRGFDPTGLTGHEDMSSLGFDLRETLLSDLKFVSECDAICLLPGWEFSKGATVELDMAVALGLDVKTLEEWLFDGTMTEHEFLQGVADELWPTEDCWAEREEVPGDKCVCYPTDRSPRSTPSLVPQEYVDTILQDSKDREARLNRLDHSLTSYEALRDLREHYPMVTIPLATPATPAAGAIAARIGETGPCDRRVPHDPHIETTGIVDNGGNIVLHECPGQSAECANCDDCKCMDCVLRYVHDECHDDCPDCCPNYRSDLVTDALRLSASPELAKEVRITSSTGGQKGKKLARYDLIPVQPLWDVAELYGYGASKYQEARNWERGYDWSLSYAALQRHANLFWSREDNDEETGLPHLAAVAFHALALMEYARTHPEFDNRPEASK